MPGIPRFTFKKDEKLKSRKLIQVLFKQGLSFSIFPFRILYIFPEENISPLQCGFAVSTKHFKNAVDRNRIKRLMREAYRLQKNNLSEVLYDNNQFMTVFFVYTGNTIPDNKDVADKIQSALKRLIKIADESIPTAT